MLAMIACMAANGVIGKDGKLPWTCSDDLQRFKRLTMGDKLIMGRKTMESLKTPLPGRKNLVFTRSPQPEKAILAGFDHIPIYHSHSYALTMYSHNPSVSWIIGGAKLYTATMAYCSILHLTILHEDYEGDTLFPLELRDQLFVEKERHAFADGWFTTWYRK